MSGGRSWWRERVRRHQRGAPAPVPPEGLARPTTQQVVEITDERNGLERLYGDAWLEPLRLAGEVSWYRFGDTSLKLAHRTWYRLDYRVGRPPDWPDPRIEIHEVKGHWEDDARVKIKVAAKAFPEFRFLAVQNLGTRKRPSWHWEEIRP